MTASNQRIFITGTGVMLPTGRTVDSLWQSAVTQTSGITPYRSEAHNVSWLKYYGRVDVAPQDAAYKTIPAKLRRFCGESTVWGIAAAKQALAEAGLTNTADQPERCGIFTAEQCHLYPGIHPFKDSLIASSETEELDLPTIIQGGINNRFTSLVLLKSLRNNLLSVASSLFQYRGDCGSFSESEGATVAALSSALFSLRHGLCNRALVIATGSSDEAWALCQLYATSYLNQSDEGMSTFCPYDQKSQGMVLGEGAVALVLESEQVAMQRGVTPLGEILGIGSQVISHAERQRASTRPYIPCVSRALRGHNSSPLDIGVVCANGKGVAVNDVYDLRNIEQALGPNATKIPVTCRTPLTGTLGTTGALIDVVMCLLMLKHGLIFPIAHLKNPQPTILNLCRDQPISVVGKYALAFHMGLSSFYSAIIIGKT